MTAYGACYCRDGDAFGDLTSPKRSRSGFFTPLLSTCSAHSNTPQANDGQTLQRLTAVGGIDVRAYRANVPRFRQRIAGVAQPSTSTEAPDTSKRGRCQLERS
jgi:hypothetical protein